MPHRFLPRRVLLTGLLGSLVLLPAAAGAQSAYFPPAGTWATKTPAELGIDAARLADAISFARNRESTRAVDFSDQQRIFGSTITMSPEHDLVVVLRWHQGNEAEFVKKVIAALR